MKNYYRTFPILVLILSLNACEQLPKKATGEPEDSHTEIGFYTADGVEIHADLYLQSKTAATILLFHQAGANARGEYATIIPRLIEEGFNVLAVDQRSGGQLFGSYNRTVAAFEVNEYGYCDAYPDLEGALDYLVSTGISGTRIVWGSSYSAALVVQLGYKRHADVTAVLAFSPASGEPMEGCEPEQYFENLEVPLLLLRPSGEMAYEHVKEQYELARDLGHQVYTGENGRHGSSMLVESRVGANVDDNWKAVLAFLGQFRSQL